MRIDDVNLSSEARAAAKSEAIGKSDAVRPESVTGNANKSCEGGTDAAAISDMANALAPSDARLEALRLQVERGEYKVSAKDVARRIIDDHTV